VTINFGGNALYEHVFNNKPFERYSYMGTRQRIFPYHGLKFDYNIVLILCTKLKAYCDTRKTAEISMVRDSDAIRRIASRKAHNFFPPLSFISLSFIPGDFDNSLSCTPFNASRSKWHTGTSIRLTVSADVYICPGHLFSHGRSPGMRTSAVCQMINISRSRL